jgi:hypothetical protein
MVPVVLTLIKVGRTKRIQKNFVNEPTQPKFTRFKLLARSYTYLLK